MLEHSTPLAAKHTETCESSAFAQCPTHFAEWRGQIVRTPHPIASAWQTFRATPTAFQAFVWSLAVVNLAVPALVGTQSAILNWVLSLLTGINDPLNGIPPDKSLPVVLKGVQLLTSLSWLVAFGWGMRLRLYGTFDRCRELIDPEAPFKQDLVRVVPAPDCLSVPQRVRLQALAIPLCVFLFGLTLDWRQNPGISDVLLVVAASSPSVFLMLKARRTVKMIRRMWESEGTRPDSSKVDSDSVEMETEVS